MDLVVSESRKNAKSRIGKRMKTLFPRGCKRVLFVFPHNVPEEDFNFETALARRYPVYPPRGFAVLNADLKRRGYITDILDLNFELQVEAEGKKQDFAYGVWKKWLRERVEKFRPDLVALSCMFTIYHRNIKRYSEFLKQEWPEIPVIAGGVHTTSAVRLVLKDCPGIDLIGLYEGDSSFGDMLEYINGLAVEEKLTQIAVIIDGEFVAVTERAEKTAMSLNLLPDYNDLPVGEYSKHTWIGTFDWLHPQRTRAATALANIGCRAQCTFCSVRSFNGRGVSSRSITSVVDELFMLRDRYGITHFMWLDDDLLNGDPIGLFNEMVQRRVGMTWDASNGVIASAMTEEIAAAAYESGCIGISIGIESGNPEILKSVKKPSGVRHFIKCADILKKYPHIFVRGLLMCGFPGETVRQLLDTKELGQRICLDWSSIQPLNLIPGVEITNHALEAGEISEKELIDGTERPFLGSTGGQVRREAAEKVQALPFENPFAWNPDRIPTRTEIKDVWFALDYEVNYRRLEREDNPLKLAMLKKMFAKICDRSHQGNALGNLYFGIIERKLGNREEAGRRLGLAREYFLSSDYWRKRFRALKLDDLLIQEEELVK